MGDSPGVVKAEAAPEASQQPSLPSYSQEQPHVSDNSITPPPPQVHQQIQQKQPALPARPHAAARHTKRLTLNFPINVPLGSVSDLSVSTPGSTTPVTESPARPTPNTTMGTPVSFSDQDESSGLLTAIASQERKVLELREELQRAEAELDTLKKQWTLSERTKKRTEIHHHAEPLVSLKSPDQADPNDASQIPPERGAGIPETPSTVQARISRDLERRQSMRMAASKGAGTAISANGRRVFHGSHTRTLSLLSPAPGSNRPSESGSDVDSGRVTRAPRSATLPSVERKTVVENGAEGAGGAGGAQTEDMISQWRKTIPPPSREALVRTGKQMASDLKEGLWTFLEDIRQATVGEEGINATESRTVPAPRKRDSSAASRNRDRLSVDGGKPSRSPSSSRSKGAETKLSGKDTKSANIDVSFWSEFGIDIPGQKSPNTRNLPDTPSETTEQDGAKKVDGDDSWDDWDTPQPKKTHTPSSSRSTLESKLGHSPVTQNSSPRTSASFGEWRATHDDFIPNPTASDGIPWPAITKFRPSNLTRTASNLMAEWERSLSSSPSPERKNQTSSPDGGDKKT